MAKYIFKNRDQQYEALQQDDPGAGEEMELSTNFLPQYEQVVERPIQSGETLRIIALNYRIPISELKRVNRLQKESEFHALNNIKIPIKANSMLSEILEEEANARNIKENNSVANSSSDQDGQPRRSHLASYSNDTEESDADSCVGYVSIQQILREKSTRREARRFLENMQEDLNKIKEKVVSDKASLSEAAAALTDPRFVPLTDPKVSSDYGISWWRLFICAVFFLLLLPIAYLIYLFNFDSGH